MKIEKCHLYHIYIKTVKWIQTKNSMLTFCIINEFFLLNYKCTSFLSNNPTLLADKKKMFESWH